MQNTLHRLTVRKNLLAWLFNMLDVLSNGIEMFWEGLRIISRENGKVDCYLPIPAILNDTPWTQAELASMLAYMADKIQQGCLSLGYGFQLLSAGFTDDMQLHVAFTNDLMAYQGRNVAGVSGFGSRGNNKQVRQILGVETFPSLLPVEATPVEATSVEATPVVPSGPSEAEIAEQAAKMLAEAEARIEALAEAEQAGAEALEQEVFEAKLAKGKGRKGRKH